MDRLEQINETLGKLMKDKPDALKNFSTFIQAAETKGVLPEKTKHLILLALGVAAQCQWCIALHTKDSVAAGATKDEILEAAMMAVVMGGGPKLMYFEVLYEELEKYF